MLLMIDESRMGGLFEFGPDQVRVIWSQLKARHAAGRFERSAKFGRNSASRNPLLHCLVAPSAGDFCGLCLASNALDCFGDKRVLFHEDDSMLEKLALQEILALMQENLAVKVLP